jgi:hypothetical protein
VRREGGLCDHRIQRRRRLCDQGILLYRLQWAVRLIGTQRSRKWQLHTVIVGSTPPGSSTDSRHYKVNCTHVDWLDPIAVQGVVTTRQYKAVQGRTRQYGHQAGAHLMASAWGRSSEKKAYFASSTLLTNERPTNALCQAQHRVPGVQGSVPVSCPEQCCGSDMLLPRSDDIVASNCQTVSAAAANRISQSPQIPIGA